MTTEQKEAVALLKDFTKMDFNNPMGWTGYYDTELKELQQAIEILLNLIQEQKAELRRLDKEAQQYFETTIKQAQTFDSQLQKKDKMIDLIIEEYEYNARINLKDFCDDELRKDKCIQDCKSCIKQYFERKVKDERYKI